MSTITGLKACSAEFGLDKPLNGIKIAVSCPKANEEAAITETLTELGATVRSCSCSCYSYLMHETRRTCCKCIKRGLDWGPGGGPNLIIDDNGYVMSFIYAGVKAEKIYAQKGGLPVLLSDLKAAMLFFPSMIREANCLSIIGKGLETDPNRYHNLKEELLGVSVGTANYYGPMSLMEIYEFFSLPVFDISDSVTKSKFCEMYGSRYAILDRIKRGLNMTISGRTALVCGYGDDSHQGCAMALKKVGAKVVVVEADSNHAIQASLRDFEVIYKAPDDVVSEADILVANFNMDNIDVLSNIKNMKHNAVIYNTGSSTDVVLFEPYFPDMKQIILDSHTEKWVSSDTNKCVFVVTNPGYPNLMSSWSATSHVVGMLEIVSQIETGKYVGKVYAFPEHLQEKVSDLHLGELKAAAAKKEIEGQAPALVSVPSQERANPFTTITADAMNMSKMLIMLIQVPIIGALVYALSKASKTELSFSAIWGGGN